MGTVFFSLNNYLRIIIVENIFKDAIKNGVHFARLRANILEKYPDEPLGMNRVRSLCKKFNLDVTRLQYGEYSLDDITEEEKSAIISEYLKTYSISETKKDKSSVMYRFSRDSVTKILKNAGVFGSSTDGKKKYNDIHVRAYKEKRQERIKKTSLERYGAENPSGINAKNARILRNSVPYQKPSFLSEDWKLYKDEVSFYTNRVVSSVEKPKYCEYTGIKFIDSSQDVVNNNDPIKRSVDHKIPVIIGYLSGISAEDISKRENLLFVLKYVNTVKGNTLHEAFLPIAAMLRKRFKDAGYQSN